MCKQLIFISVLILLITLSLPTIEKALSSTEVDESIGTLPRLAPKDLVFYQGKHVMVVGGTRGVGFGAALAIAQAGGKLTIVGRSYKSGEIAVQKITDQVPGAQVKYISADFATVKGVLTFVHHLEEDNAVFDAMIVSVAVFPDWDDLLTEDGMEKSLAVMIMGRHLFYQHADKFLTTNGRLLSVAVAGSKARAERLDRDLIQGKRNLSNIVESLQNLALLSELILIDLADSWVQNNLKIINTHPGFIGTDLHKGQGLLFDLFEQVMVYTIGISEEEAGLRQATILASDKIVKKVSYFDPEMTARVLDPNIITLDKSEGGWFINFLNNFIENKSK
eukprot:TRINITY_DN12351_c0_g1_i1.p1 TRINITY_DN12351_c0_g1~~TRINITY_DN12351_c0_g1_i1.p1  ORF type:complete len:335 (-),score=74.66 TRINITY_DN12351_c0_g1_i1:31-1035(-)